MPHYVNESGYTEAEEIRAKVGSGKPEHQRLFLLDRERRQASELDLGVLPGIDEDPLAELRAAAREREKQRKDEQDQEEGKPRPVSLLPPVWSDDGQRVVLQAFSQDNKDRWLAAVDLEAAEVRPLHRMHDPAWINWRFQDLGWLRDHRTLFFLSEQSGYSQLYLIEVDDRSGGGIRRLTAGEHVVDDAVLSADGRFIYYTANAGHPGVYEIWRVEPESGRSQRISELDGRNEAVLSPAGDRLLVTHSSSTRPPELWVQQAEPGAEARQLTSTTSDAFLDVEWTAPEIVAVPSSHGARPIHARLYLPGGPSDDPRPAVVFVHGAGYLQNAHRGWSSYFREFMFHTLLTRRGWVVLDMDYRGSAGYGRDWRTAIYRQMGGPELEDLADGAAWLVRHHGVDPERIGVYGGSYGGFLTLMALFERPELFAAGAALRPVTDWAHYNHPYTSNILNTPELDPVAYERSSPIEHAEGLTKPLLICTGMLDDNVLFQDSVRLVQRLIELEKQDWEIAIYPLEPHGFREPSSWLDEYRRILALFEEHLE
jgi:dipeptidyl aminopeptidase/acylaminoacyl peptidase